MKKLLTMLAIVGLISTGNAFAWGSGHHDDHDDHDDHHDHHDRNHKTVNNKTVNNNNRATGGKGVGVGVGIGKGGNANSSSRSGVKNSGNSRNDNRNLNAQGQKQGQVGIVKGGNTRVRTGDVNASSRNKLNNDSNSSSNANVYIGGGRGEGQGGRTLSPTAKQQQSLDGNNSSIGDISVSMNMPEEGLTRDLSTTVLDSRDLSTAIDSSSVVYEAQDRNPVSSAWAAPLVTSNDTCMGSTSAGGQGITLGLSFATTWSDKDCVIRKDARFLHNAQHGPVALGLMCEKASVRRAVERAGTPAEKAACGLAGSSSAPAVAAVPVSHLDDDYDDEGYDFGK